MGEVGKNVNNFMDVRNMVARPYSQSMGGAALPLIK
jgi:hypothetical protein